jgi:hypothetical protein
LLSAGGGQGEGFGLGVLFDGDGVFVAQHGET